MAALQATGVPQQPHWCHTVSMMVQFVFQRGKPGKYILNTTEVPGATCCYFHVVTKEAETEQDEI